MLTNVTIAKELRVWSYITVYTRNSLYCRKKKKSLKIHRFVKNDFSPQRSCKIIFIHRRTYTLDENNNKKKNNEFKIRNVVSGKKMRKIVKAIESLLIEPFDL